MTGLNDRNLAIVQLFDNGPMVQRIERRFPMPEICVRFALGPQKCPRGVMESTKHYGCFGRGSNPLGGTKL